MTHVSGTTSTSAHPLGPTDSPLTFEELELAFRNRGMPLEALRYDLTPSGIHYRATDEAGNVQPLEQPWNYQGMGNNIVQTVRVTVRT